jgi:hypothetical protein
MLLPALRLSRDAKEMVEKRKDLVYLGRPMTVRRNRMNPSGVKKACEQFAANIITGKKTLCPCMPFPLSGF